MYNSKPNNEVWSIDLSHPENPQWFKESIEMPPGDNFVGVGDGKNIAYLANKDGIFKAGF